MRQAPCSRNQGRNHWYRDDEPSAAARDPAERLQRPVYTWDRNGTGESQDARRDGYIGFGNPGPHNFRNSGSRWHTNSSNYRGNQNSSSSSSYRGNQNNSSSYRGNQNNSSSYRGNQNSSSSSYRGNQNNSSSYRGNQDSSYREYQKQMPASQETNKQNGNEAEPDAGKSVRIEAPLDISQEQMYRRAILTQTDDEQWPQTIGTCPDMCPASERENRARLGDLAVFERLNDDRCRTSKELAVKKFCRTFTGKDLKQSDIRPLSVLYHTMDHLMKTLDKRDYSFQLVHDFLFDRTRAVRQELSMQRITDKKAISITEIIVRFHIVSERELRQQRVFGKAFDSHLNFQQLTKSLTSLLSLYITNGSPDLVANEAEFSCYHVLLSLNQPQQLSLWFKGARPTLLRTDDMQFARNILRCYQQKNFYRFFSLARHASYLQSCLLELYFNEVRAFAVNAINRGAYKLHPYRLSDLSELLLMEEGDAEEFCLVHGLAVGLSASSEAQLLVKQAEFSTPKQGTKHYYCKVIQDKRPASLEQICCSSNSTLA